ncbi:MAG: hypothetical protein ACK5MN_10610 [Lachnospiraceae bacterium]
MMWKRIFAALLSFLMTLTLAACGNSTMPPSASESDSSVVDNGGDSAANVQSITPNETPPESEPVKDMELPDDLSQCAIGDSWAIYSQGFEPKIIKTCTTENGFITLSVPEISDSLKQFAKAHGYSYIMEYAENTSTGNFFACLMFYKEVCNLRYQDIAMGLGYVLDYMPNRPGFYFTVSQLGLGSPQINEGAYYMYYTKTTADDGSVALRGEDELFSSAPSFADYIGWGYSETSLYPDEDRIQTVIQALETSEDLMAKYGKQ